MKLRHVVFLMSLGVMLTGCATTGVLTQPYKLEENIPVLVVYTENPMAHVNRGVNANGQNMYEFFDDWFFDAFASNCTELGIKIFDREVVYKFTKRNKIKIKMFKENETATNSGSPEILYSFSDTSIPKVLDTASELGANTVIKAKLISYTFQENVETHRSGMTESTGTYRKINAVVKVSAFDVEKQKKKFERTISISTDDPTFPFGVFLTNVKEKLTTIVVEAIQK